MSHWTNIRTWKTAHFVVTLDWTWEDDPDLSWDENGSVAANIESGEWGNFTFRVRVTCDGREISADYLGNSIYADPEQFYLEHIGSNHCYFSDMMRTAIREAREALCNTPRVRCVA